MGKDTQKSPEHQANTQPSAEVRAINPGFELFGKHLIGRDPRQMRRDELRSLGYRPHSPLHALRQWRPAL